MPDLVFIANVVIGSAIGGVMRFMISGLVARAVGETFPWGTMVVNATGALAIGVIAALAQHHRLPIDWDSAWTLVVTGALGSYTTVSSFSLQTLALARTGQWRQAGANILLSLVLCLCAVALGFTATVAVSGA